MTLPARTDRIRRIADSGEVTAGSRAIAVECPVAIEVNGMGYAVIMASPDDLEDFAVGFTFAERLIDDIDQVEEIICHPMEQGIRLSIFLTPDRAGLVADRVRHRIGESSCGLCGIENLEQAIRPLPRVTAACHAKDAALFAALGTLRDHQPLGMETGGAHAAALCCPDGAIRLVREDVGRHSAFDKLIGAMRRQGLSWDGGFALLTSRCSYELVEKAALAGCPLLATISVATSLAIDRAREAGLPLRMLARPDAVLAVDP